MVVMYNLVVRVLSILLLIAYLTSATACGRVINSQAKNKIRIQRTIASAAQYVGVPYKILIAVCFVESSHRELDSVPDGSSLSYGVCQVKLETAEYMDRLYGLVPVTPEALSDTWTNAYYAAKYLQFQYKRYGDWKKAIDGYNKGTLVSDRSQYVNKVMLALRENE